MSVQFRTDRVFESNFRPTLLSCFRVPFAFVFLQNCADYSLESDGIGYFLAEFSETSVGIAENSR